MNEEPQTIDELKSRYDELELRRQTAQTGLTVAETQLNMAKRNAKEAYGTDDIKELEEKLELWRSENEKKRSEYQQSLDEIEAALRKVSEEHETN
jgi:hypothetical protein